MITGKNFACAHIPRAGGDVTTELFELTNELMNHNLIITVDSRAGHWKHDTFTARNIKHGFVLALNMRRLPSFIMSWIIMCAGRLRVEDPKNYGGGVYPHYGLCLPAPSKKQLLDKNESYGPSFFHEHYSRSFATLPDSILGKYMSGYHIDHWIRIEHLNEDFLKFIKAITGTIDEQQAEAIRQYKCIAKKPLIYNHNVEDFFSKSELQILYDNNPLWRDIEERIYP